MSNSDFIYRFFSGDRPQGNRTISHQNLMMDRHTLYSYGSHFPLAVETIFGKYILNGEKYSNTTSQHQDITRRMCNWLFIEIPFSALSNAGIEPRLIQILDQTKSQWRTVKYIDKDGKEKEREQHLLGASLIRVAGNSGHYLSGTDPSAHWGHGYFLTELPEPVETIKKAFNCLKPQEVIDAEKKGTLVLRQGEWFFVYFGKNKKLPEILDGLVLKDQILLFTGKPENRLNWDKINSLTERGYYLPRVGKNPNGDTPHHKVTRCIPVPNSFLCSGTVRHDNREHRMLKLGNDWFLAYPSRQIISYSGYGQVD